jgi:hypothetical protein
MIVILLCIDTYIEHFISVFSVPWCQRVHEHVRANFCAYINMYGALTAHRDSYIHCLYSPGYQVCAYHVLTYIIYPGPTTVSQRFQIVGFISATMCNNDSPLCPSSLESQRDKLHLMILFSSPRRRNNAHLHHSITIRDAESSISIDSSRSNT